jgi:hypothetical protein
MLQADWFGSTSWLLGSTSEPIWQCKWTSLAVQVGLIGSTSGPDWQYKWAWSTGHVAKPSPTSTDPPPEPSSSSSSSPPADGSCPDLTEPAGLSAVSCQLSTCQLSFVKLSVWGDSWSQQWLYLARHLHICLSNTQHIKWCT